jgi:DNA-binding NarL/FixJ family response regulator
VETKRPTTSVGANRGGRGAKPNARQPSIDVLVVDDHVTFAEALAMALRLEQDLAVRVAPGGAEAIDLAQVARPDVALVDVEMPATDGIEVIRRLRELYPGLPIVVVSGHDDDLTRARAIEAGAIGYLSKLTPIDEIPDAIRTAHGGKKLIDTEEAARLLRVLHHRRHQEATERQRANRLTPRQIEILQMLADGIPVQEIAGRLRMTRLTLRTHVQNILTRLGVHTKVEAVTVAIRQGKISPGAGLS